MSATLNAAMFAGYFEGAPVVSIPGRAHPVTALFLEGTKKIKENNKKNMENTKNTLRARL
jgi:HrpA-like RNA helicase